MDKLDPEWTQFAVFANHDRVQVDMIRPFVGEDFGYVQELAAPKSSIAWSILECGNFQARCHLSATVIVLKRRIHIVRLVLNTHFHPTFCSKSVPDLLHSVFVTSVAQIPHVSGFFAIPK